MKTFRKLFTLCLVLALCLTSLPAAFAATVPTATIDTSRPTSLSLYKYDFTTANADGVLELDSYVSTGLPNEAVEQALSAYAIQGVVFRYVKVADIVTHSVQEADSYKNMVLYRMTDNIKATQLLSALGLTKADAYRSKSGALDFTSDTLNHALSAKLEENASALKNALEQFAIHNDTDGYFVLAQWNEAESCYYVTGHAAEEAKATKFVPNQDGQIIVKGLEDDAYTLTELQTDSGYTLLKNAIQIVITAQGDGEFCSVCGKEGVTATATVNGDAVAMQENNGSLRATVPLTVVNTKSFDLPQTGDNGALILTISGVVMLLCAAGCILYLLAGKRRQRS